jgi:hypothetical protein
MKSFGIVLLLLLVMVLPCLATAEDKDLAVIAESVSTEFVSYHFHFLVSREKISEAYRSVQAKNPALASGQAHILREQIAKVRAVDPAAVVDIICQSQGAIIVALARPAGIRKIIMLAPPTSSSTDRMVKMFQSRSGTAIDMQGVSRLARADGSTTQIPPEYWAERKNVDPLKLYGELAQMTELTIINAKQDDVLDKGSFAELKGAQIINLDGSHNFSGENRKKLLETVANIIRN